jgi:hypothetical protein
MRRRDELVQSRTGDRFSDGLRVLRRRRSGASSGQRSGDAVLTSPRVVVDTDGEFLYIPADRALAAREAALAALVTEAAPADEAAEAVAEAVAVEAGSVDSVEGEPEGSAGSADSGDAAGSAVTEVPAEVPMLLVSSGSQESGPTAAERSGEFPLPTFASLVGAGREAGEPTVSTLLDAEPATRRSDSEVSEVSEDAAGSVDSAGSAGSAEADSVTGGGATAEAPAPEVEPVRPPAAPVAAAYDCVPAERPEAVPVAARRSFAEFAALEDLARDLESALLVARTAARRRARIMGFLLLATAVSWGIAFLTPASTWIVVPASVLLGMHLLASRVAALRSREAITVLAAHVHAAELAEARDQRRREALARARQADAAAAEAVVVPERVTRRAAVVGADTWEPVPVPPPTYTLKPAVHRPESIPLDPPAAPAAPAATAAEEAAAARAKLPRRAADVERILALESDVDRLFEDRKAVNG